MNRLALASLFTLAACDGGMIEQNLAAPSELTVSQLGVGLHLTWKDNSPDEDEFQIERKSGSGGFAMVASVVFDIVQYHDEPVAFDTPMTYRVRAMKGNVPSPYSAAVTATAMALTGTGGGGGSTDAGTGGGTGGGTTGGGGGTTGGGGGATGGGGGGAGRNLPPTCTIANPAAGVMVPFDQMVTFSANASDPEEGSLTGARVVWTSNRVTPSLGSGLTLTRTLPLPGVHTVTCTATDTQGLSGSSSVAITAFSPVARLNHPSNGETRAAANAVPFAGDGRDFYDGALPDAGLVWTSSIDGVIGTGRSFSRTISAGTNVITLTVTNSDGGTGSQSITLTMTP